MEFCGKTMRTKRKTKNNRNAARAALPPRLNGGKAAASLTIGFSAGSGVLASVCGAGLPVKLGARRKAGKRLKNLAISTPDTAAQAVQIMDVPTMAVGLVDLLATRMAMAVTGITECHWC